MRCRCVATGKPLDVWGTFEELAAKSSPWNYALMLDAKTPASSIRFKRLAISKCDGHLWENSPLALEVQARRIPAWKFDVPPPSKGLKGRQPKPPTKFWDIGTKLEGAKTRLPRAAKLPDEPFVVADDLETIQLVPYGFTLLADDLSPGDVRRSETDADYYRHAVGCCPHLRASVLREFLQKP